MLPVRVLLNCTVALLSLSATLTVSAQQTSPSGYSPQATQPEVTNNFSRTPLNFEANQGQAPSGVDAIAHGPGYALLLRQGEASIQLAEAHTELRLHLVGADPKAQWHPEQEQSSKTSYFLGNDPSRWHTGIPNYAQVRYADIYPGIDVVYYGNNHTLEHDFVLASGADPSRIQIEVSGAKSVRVDDSTGNLLLATEAGDLLLKKPVAYQNNTSGRSEIQSSYAISENGTVSFHLADYDHSQPLVIDPELSYSTLVPSGPVAIDSKGAAYLIGQIANGANGMDVALYKLSPGGSALLYTAIFGGTGNDSPAGVAVDPWGYAYITGNTNSQDFPTLNPYQSTFQGTGSNAQDAFVVKINQLGNGLVYSTYLGGGAETAKAIAVDSAPRAFVVGSTRSPNFPTYQALQPNLKGTINLYVTAFSQSGSSVLYSTYLGGSGADLPGGIAVDSKEDVYVAGTTQSSDFPVKNALQPTNKNPSIYPTTGFITKIYPTGSQLIYSTYLGGSLGDSINGIAIDASGNAYVAGTTYSSDFPVANAYQPSGGPGMGQIFPCEAYYSNTAFVSKLNPTGSALVYSTYLGPINTYDTVPYGDCQGSFALENSANGIAVDSSGDALVTGSTFSTYFPVTSDAYQSSNQGNNNCASTAFLTKFNPDGSSLLYSTYFGGPADSGNDADYCNGIGGAEGINVAVDPLGNAYMLGEPSSAMGPFPFTDAAYQTNFYGHYNWSFLAKFAFGTTYHTTTTVTAVPAQTYGANTYLLTATVQSSDGGTILPGSVGFVVDSSINAGSASLNSEGIATLQYTFTTQGQHTVQAFYGGTINTDASVGSLTQAFAIANAPGISPAAGTYHYVPTVTITDRLATAVIHYTTDGSNPTASSPTYTAPIQITQSITLKATTPSATFYYTTDGSTPTTSSIPYTGPILVSHTETLNAIAIATGYTASPVATASYTITTTTAAAPAFSSPGGTYNAEPVITITDSTPGAVIHYLITGATATAASPVYSGPITLTQTRTVSAIAVVTGLNNSAVTSATYTLVAAPPVVSPAGGTYSTAQTVTMTTATPTATIFYTTDNTLPSASSKKYTGPITVSASEHINAITIQTGFTSSSPVLNYYVISGGSAAQPTASHDEAP